MNDPARLKALEPELTAFCCEKDPSIEIFLRQKAIHYEKRHKSRTTLVMDEEALENGQIKIVGYFSLAQKVLSLPNASNTLIKALDGFSAKKKGKKITDFPVFLIGQLAKNDTYKDCIEGAFLVDYALAVIRQVHEEIGGRVVLVECEDKPKLISFYTGLKFKKVAKDEDGLVQFISYL